MNLLLLDQFSDLGGAQQCLLELLPAFVQRGWKALAGLPGQGEMFQRVRAAGFPAERVDCGPYTSGSKSWRDAGRFVTGTPRLARQIRVLAEQIQADLVYVNGPRLLPATALAGLRIPVLFHSHSYLFPGMTRKLAGMALRRVDATVVGSCDFVAEPWRPFVRKQRLSIVYNGVAGPAQTRPQRGNRPPRIGCIGRIAPEKGQREFLAAAALIHRAVPECCFVVYGAPLFADAGAARYFDAVRAAAAGLPVEFAGWTADVYSALAELDMLLVPSAGHEATTRVILEALAAGVPVVAFRSGGIPEVLDDGRNGWLAASVEEMAGRAVEVLVSPRERIAAMSRAAVETWRTRFTLQRYRAEIVEATERAVRCSNPPRQ